MQKEPNFWDDFNPHQIIGIASRLKRLSELLFARVQELYEKRNRNFKSTWFLTLTTIRKFEEIDFKTLAAETKVSSPAISQTIREIEKQGLVKIIKGEDKRSRIITLTAKGEKAINSVIPDLLDIEHILKKVLDSRVDAFLDTLEFLENEFKEKSFLDFLKVEIIDYRDKYKKDFEKLNREWLEEHFELEEYDKQLFGNPQEQIIGKGGKIFLAKQNDKVIGTIALIPHSKKEIEISKLCISKLFRGRGFSKLLLDQAIKYAKDNNYQEVIAFSNTKLETALDLYKKYKFESKKFNDKRYKRVDIKLFKTL